MQRSHSAVWRLPLTVIAIAALALALVACSSAKTEPTRSTNYPTAQPTGTALPATGNQGSPAGGSNTASADEIDYTADITFTLETGLFDGNLAFRGVGGDIDGVVNPDLDVSSGDTVQITLVNGDGILHDWTTEELNASTDQINAVGASSSTVFVAGEDGEYSYFCSLPGHRAAGMEGRIVVGAGGAVDVVDAASVVRDPADMPGPIGDREPQTVRVDLETIEVAGRLANGTTYRYWTFDGLIPGPMIRVREGDTVELHLGNADDSLMAHSIDLHAVTGPGGGAVSTQTAPGGETSFTFKALKPGLYVYHCATPMVAQHIANGMYGMILVEPGSGLPEVDREFYVMQGELYTQGKLGLKGAQEFDVGKLLDEQPEYFVLNGAVGSLTADHPMYANVGETVRIYFGVGGPNFTSSFHVIGEIFDRVYDLASISSPALEDVQTTLVPPGGATIVEFAVEVPGRYILVDHALSRLERGLAGFLYVEGDDNPEVFQGGVTPGSGH